MRDDAIRMPEREKQNGRGLKRARILKHLLRLASAEVAPVLLPEQYLEHSAVGLRFIAQHQEYRVGVRGFPVDPGAWGEHPAGHRAFEIPGLRVR